MDVFCSNYRNDDTQSSEGGLRDGFFWEQKRSSQQSSVEHSIAKASLNAALSTEIHEYFLITLHLRQETPKIEAKFVDWLLGSS